MSFSQRSSLERSYNWPKKESNLSDTDAQKRRSRKLLDGKLATIGKTFEHSLVSVPSIVTGSKDMQLSSYLWPSYLDKENHSVMPLSPTSIYVASPHNFEKDPTYHDRPTGTFTMASSS